MPDTLVMTSTRESNKGRQRHLRLLGSLIALTILGQVVTACESTTQDRNEVIELINQSRVEAGLGPVVENTTLDMKADAWATHLRDACALSHSVLKHDVPQVWNKLGENVGFGGTIAQIHEAYLDSPGHRANIMDPAFTEVGAAAVWGQCGDQYRVFTVQVFMQP